MDRLAPPTSAEPIGTGVQTLDRALAVLDAVARAGRITLTGLVESTGLARPTTHRLAQALVAHGLLMHDGRGYGLGAHLVALGAQAARNFALVDIARPVLDALAAQTGESAQLYVRDGSERVCVATAERSSGLRDTVPLGARLALERGSGGKVLRAWSSDAGAGRELAAVRRVGYATSVAEREVGVASVSAPVRDRSGAVVAAISVSGPVERMRKDRLAALGALVVGAAAEIEGRA